MITESVFWKEPLVAGAALIRDFMDREELSDDEFAQIERELFIGFYSVRKLLEATGKVSNSTRRLQVSVTWYPKRLDAPLADWYNRNNICELYEMDDRRSEDRDLLYVAHRLIHSFIFMLSGDDDGHGVFFTSDHDKDMRLNFVSTAEIVRIFEIVGNDYPSKLHCWRDPQTGEMKWRVPEDEEDYDAGP